MKGKGLPRYIAVFLLAECVRPAVGGPAMLFGNPGAGPIYDAMLHAAFGGFVFSMIFGHAPVIFSVLGISIPFRPGFYVHVLGLHLSLVLHVAGDVSGVLELRS